jgi:hypothetical protein
MIAPYQRTNYREMWLRSRPRKVSLFCGTSGAGHEKVTSLPETRIYSHHCVWEVPYYTYKYSHICLAVSQYGIPSLYGTWLLLRPRKVSSICGSLAGLDRNVTAPRSGSIPTQLLSLSETALLSSGTMTKYLRMIASYLYAGNVIDFGRWKVLGFGGKVPAIHRKVTQWRSKNISSHLQWIFTSQLVENNQTTLGNNLIPSLRDYTSPMLLVSVVGK